MKPRAAVYKTWTDTCTDVHMCTHTYTDTWQVKDGQSLIGVVMFWLKSNYYIMITKKEHKKATSNNK